VAVSAGGSLAVLRRSREAVGWQPIQTAVRNQPNEHGRIGAGASSHCAHGFGGDVLREYLDWRPFSYFTNRFTPLIPGLAFFPGVETIEFIPTDAGTTMVYYRFRLDECGRLTRLRARAMASLQRRVLSRSRESLRRVMEEDGCLEASPSSVGIEEEPHPASSTRS
jgi:hypothetical protein